MSDSEQNENLQSDESSMDQDDAILFEDGEVLSSHSSDSLIRDKEYMQEAEGENYFSHSFSSSLVQDQRDNNAHEYQETEENRAMREAMERMVSSAISEENEASDEDIIVLSPEHPMLKSFHKSVNLHLQKQKKIILNDIRELVRYNICICIKYDLELV